MHAKYKVSLSYSSKVKVKVKGDNRETGQKQDVMPPVALKSKSGKICKSYILTPPHSEGHVMQVSNA